MMQEINSFKMEIIIDIAMQEWNMVISIQSNYVQIGSRVTVHQISEARINFCWIKKLKTDISLAETTIKLIFQRHGEKDGKAICSLWQVLQDITE